MSRAGFSNKQAKTDAVTLIQRFGSALNVNTYFHMLFLEAAINQNSWGSTNLLKTRRAAAVNGRIATLYLWHDEAWQVDYLYLLFRISHD
ncbi:MAG: hypothetical protein ACI8XG_000975 [Congregibacter sp.]